MKKTHHTTLNTHTRAASLTRRHALLASTLSFGSVAMRSVITGLPAAFLMGKPEHTWAATGNAKYLILSHQQQGDPLNANCPGTYADANNANDPRHQIERAQVKELGSAAEGFENPVAFNLGSQTVRAAKCWSELPQELLDRSAFWHHGTFTNAHIDFKVVMGLNGALKGPNLNGSDHIGSFIAQENAEQLGTLSKEFIRVGGSSTLSSGVPAPELKPTLLKSIFTANVVGFDNMVAMRDQFIDQTYADIKTRGTAAQRAFLDRYAISQQEAQALGDSLGGLIEDIDDNSTADQAKMAAALIQLKVSPVITLGFDFGGDNHNDADLAREVSETTQTIDALKVLWQKLVAAGIEDQVAFASMNVFGRTLLRSASGGRDHNGRHHAMYVFGANIKPGVIGGLETYIGRRGTTDFSATAIHSAGGAARGNADIPYEETLSAVGKTLAAAVGVPTARINQRIDGGKIITGGLVSR
ncbi:DUF1501 domain-containing protein [Marinagarivorans algicola]|uniref:DUF1501 domain-containing protein n=1 Tax=Marinagarivorans algicola TaxID=1513270 RepID=UPI003734C500